MPRPRLLVNPAAGRGRGLRWVRAWRDAGLQRRCDVVLTRSPHDLVDEANRAVADRIERLLVLGGDGTLHRVLDALSGSGTILGIIPVGTGNDFAMSLGIPTAPREALDRALTCPARRLDLGDVEGRAFAGIAGVGFVGEVAGRVRDGFGKWLGPFAYAAAALAELRAFDAPRVRVEHDGGCVDDRMMLALVANGSRFGGGMRVAPDAQPDDGMLDLVLVHRCGRLELARALPSVYSGRHVGHPRVEILRTSRAVFEVDRPTTVWGDGEPMVELAGGAVRFRVRPGALAVALVPAATS